MSTEPFPDPAFLQFQPCQWVLYPGGILLPSKQNSGSSWWHLTQNWNKASSRLPRNLSKILLLPRVLKVGKKSLPYTYSPQIKDICGWRTKINSILEGKVGEGWERSGTAAESFWEIRDWSGIFLSLGSAYVFHDIPIHYPLGIINSSLILSNCLLYYRCAPSNLLQPLQNKQLFFPFSSILCALLSPLKMGQELQPSLTSRSKTSSEKKRCTSRAAVPKDWIHNCGRGNSWSMKQ